ncbi:MAG: hypothetical protein KAJ45_09075, partial [Desulfobulbaceae bacterium]|nr:hypothetical protein [Desulfobulbaceae bacterium]
PYGCTEQTLNRFVPTVITQNVLKRLGPDLAEIKAKQTNLNAQELGSHAERAAQWKHWEQSPVFDEDEVVRMVKKGVMRLTSMQLSDGGWGWFSGWGEHSSPHTTATVVHGLQIAMENRVAIVPSVMSRGIDWLARYQDKEAQKIKNHRKDPKVRPWKEHADNIDAFVYRVLADADILNPDMREFLYEDRNRLSVYGKALYGLGLERQGHLEKLKMIMKNIDQYLVLDHENQTAYLNLGNRGYWWHWYGSEIEAHACYLKLLCRTDPHGDKAPRLVKYLLNNRKHATYWNSTRDTAYCIEAFAEYLKASGEETPDMTVFIMIDGKKMKQVRITPENLFTFENSLVL